MNDIRLGIHLDGGENVSRPFAKARQAAKNLSGSLTETAKKVRSLERTSGDIRRFRELRQKAAANATSLANARAKVADLAAKMRESDAAALKYGKAFEKARDQARRLKDGLGNTRAEVETMRRKLHAAGIDTKKLSSAQKTLTERLQAAKAAAGEEAAALDLARQKTSALAKARARLDRVLQRQQALAVTGTAALMGGRQALRVGGGTVSQGMNFEEAMSGVAGIARIDKTSAAFAALEAQAERLGATTSFSATEAAGGMEFLAMAGFNANQILASMPEMLNLAKAGRTELAATADIASNILSGFKLPAEEMGRVADVLTSAFTRSNTDLAKLGETMKYVAPIAAEVGTSIEDAAAMAGLLGNVGIQGSQAGTALRAIHNRLAGGTKASSKALDELGIDAKNAEGNLRPMVDILAEVANTTATMGSADRMGFFKAIAGEEAGAAMAQLVSESGAGKIVEFAEILRASSGEAARVAAAMGDNLAGDVKAWGSALEGLSIALTKLNIRPLRDFVQWGTSAVRTITEWTTANPELAGWIGRIAGGAAILATTFGGLALASAAIMGPLSWLGFGVTKAALGFGLFGSLAKGVVAGIGTLGKAFLAAGRLMMANPILAVIGLIAMGAYLIIENWETVGPFLEGIFDAVAGAVLEAWDGIKGAWQSAGEFFAGIWAGIGDGAAAAWEGIKSGFLSYHQLGIIIANWAPITEFLGDLWGDLVAGAFDTWQQLQDELATWSPLPAIRAGFDPVLRYIRELWDAILAKITAVWAKISPIFSAAKTGTDAIAGAISSVADGAAGAWESATGFAGDVADGAAGLAQDAWKALGGGIPTPVPVAPTAAAMTGDAPAITDNRRQDIVINVNAPAGADPKEVARMTARELQAATGSGRANSSFLDDPSP